MVSTEGINDDLIREPDPDADRPYEDDIDMVRVHIYGRGEGYMPRQDLFRGMESQLRDFHAVSGSYGSGFSPEERAAAQARINARFAHMEREMDEEQELTTKANLSADKSKGAETR